MSDKPEDKVKKEEEIYEAPRLITEPLLTFGAVCNGTPIGGRKDSVTPPVSCSPARLKS